MAYCLEQQPGQKREMRQALLRTQRGPRLLQQRLQVGERAQRVQRVAQARQVWQRQLAAGRHRVQARRERCQVRAAGGACGARALSPRSSPAE